MRPSPERVVPRPSACTGALRTCTAAFRWRCADPLFSLWRSTQQLRTQEGAAQRVQ